MKLLKVFVTFAVLVLPGYAHASDFQSTFVQRCLAPLMAEEAFETAGFVGPVALPKVDIGVEGVYVERRVWETGDPDVSFATLVSEGVFRGCGVTVKAFDGAPVRILESVLAAVGQTSEICHFDLTYRDLRGYRAVVREAGSGLPVLINFSPIEGRGYNLLAWEIGQDKVDKACAR